MRYWAKYLLLLSSLLVFPNCLNEDSESDEGPSDLEISTANGSQSKEQTTLPNQEAEIEDLIGQLNNSFEKKQKQVARLVDIGSPAVPKLLAALDDPFKILTVLHVLGQIGDRNAVQPLLEVMKHKEDAVRMMASQALSRIGDFSAVPVMINRLRMDDFIWMLISRDLCELTGEDIEAPDKWLDWYSTLRAKHAENIRNDDPLARSEALEAMEKFKDPDDIPLLIQVLKDSEAGHIFFEPNDIIKTLKNLTGSDAIMNKKEWIAWFDASQR